MSYCRLWFRWQQCLLCLCILNRQFGSDYILIEFHRWTHFQFERWEFLQSKKERSSYIFWFHFSHLFSQANAIRALNNFFSTFCIILITDIISKRDSLFSMWKNASLLVLWAKLWRIPECIKLCCETFVCQNKLFFSKPYIVRDNSYQFIQILFRKISNSIMKMVNPFRRIRSVDFWSCNLIEKPSIYSNKMLCSISLFIKFTTNFAYKRSISLIWLT